LEQEQTLDNLTAFGERLDREYKKMKEEQRATETT
jgi:molybdenum-dependent DNA-binding transcriptional regulator ModE